MPFFKSNNKAKGHKTKTLAPAPATPFDPYYGFSDGFSGSENRRGSDSSSYQHQSPLEGGQYICTCKACTCGESVQYPGDMCHDCANDKH